jgi:C4-dicarboxylate transporter DctQ subunit
MMTMKKWIALFDGLENIFAYTAGFFLIAMMFIEVYEVIARYFLHRPPIWAVETCEYLLFFVAFLGAAWLLRKKGHISVDLLLERLKARNRTYLNLFSSFIGIAVSFIILWFSMKTSWENYVTGVKVVKTLSLPKWFFLFFIGLGYLLLFFEFIRQFSGHLRSLRFTRERGQIS